MNSMSPDMFRRATNLEEMVTDSTEIASAAFIGPRVESGLVLQM